MSSSNLDADRRLIRRVQALDALYLNADRRAVEYADNPTLANRYRWRAARVAYEQLRDSPFAQQGEKQAGGK